MDEARDAAERKFMELSLAHIEQKTARSLAEYEKAEQELGEAMGVNSADYKEALAAITTVRNRVRQETAASDRKRWSSTLEELDEKKYGKPAAKRPTRRNAPPSNPGNKNGQNRGQKSTNNQAKGRQGQGRNNRRGRPMNQNLLANLLTLLGGNQQ